jgi:hypothetical protein
MTVQQPETTTLPLDRLVDHPRQEDYFWSESEQADQQLREDLEQNGQREPIVCLPAENAAELPDYCVLDGHRRLTQMRELGWSSARVRIRHDLIDAPEEEVELEFISANYIRRQLPTVDQIRLERKRLALQAQRNSRRWFPHDEPQLRKRVAQNMDMSVRNVARYCAVIDGPDVIEEGVRDGEINLNQAARVGNLPEDEQQKLADAVDEVNTWHEAKALVQKYLEANKNPRRSRRDIMTLVRRLIGPTEQLIDELEQHMAEVPDDRLEPHAQQLNRLHDVLQKLCKKANDPQTTEQEINEQQMRARLETIAIRQDDEPDTDEGFMADTGEEEEDE